MTKYILGFLLLFAAAPASAQVFVSAGMGWPLGPEETTDLFSSGFGAGAGVHLENTEYPFVRIRPQGVYQKFTMDPAGLQAIEDEIEDSLAVGVDVTGGDMGIIFAGVDAQIRIPNASVTPYVAPALGVAFVAIDDITIEAPGTSVSYSVQDGDETAFAIGIGAGLAAALGDRFELFAEGHYMYAFRSGDDQSWVPVRFGVALSLDEW